MNIINAFTWWQWGILAIVPPLVILLYFLKLKRQPLAVPSTYLWSRTIEDLHVNSIWQRLRNNLLLWLQLLIVLLLLMCGFRPGCQGEQLQGDRFIFLIDTSASMAATDRGKSRLDLAKEEVENLIDRMGPEDVAMIISFSDRAYPHQSYTDNKSLLKRKLKEIKQTQHRTDLREALVAASGLANPGRTSNREDERDYQVAEAREATLFIVSDGGVRDVPDFSMIGLTPEYHAIGGFEAPDNIGIIAFSVSTSIEDASSYQAFARIENYSDEDRVIGASLYANGELFDSQAEIAIKANQTTGISFDLDAAIDQFDLPVELKLVLERDDDLAIDNEAFAILNRPRQARVLVITDGNRFLEYALLTEQNQKVAVIEFQPPSFIDSDEFQSDAQTGSYDLIMFDRCAPEKNPPCNTFYINAKPPDERWEFTDAFNPVVILDYSRAHPITQYLVLGRLVIVESRAIKESPSATIPLIETTQGAIMSIGPRAGFQDVVMAFSIIDTNDDGTDQLNTDWPNHLSFPLLMQNAVGYLGGVAQLKVDENTRTGDFVQLKSDDAFESITVKQPNGKNTSVRKNPNNVFMFADTGTVGVYKITGQGESESSDMFAVNLMDRRESDIRVREKLEIGFEEIAKSSGRRPIRREWWKWLVIGALAVLVVEWIVYNRRIFM